MLGAFFYFIIAAFQALSWTAEMSHELAVTLNEGELTQVAYSPDGRYLARFPYGISGSELDRVEIWEAATGQQVYAVDRVMYFHWLAAEGQFLIGTFGPTSEIPVIYDLDTQAEIMDLSGERFYEWWNRDPRWLVMQTGESVTVRRAEDFETVFTFQNGTITLSATGQYLLHSQDGNHQLIELASGETLFEFAGDIRHIAFRPDDSAFLIQENDSITIYPIDDSASPKTIQETAHYQGCGGRQAPIWFNESPRILISSYQSSTLWDYEKGEDIRFTGGVFLSAARNRIARFDAGKLIVQDGDTLEVIYEVEDKGEFVSWSPNDRWLVSYDTNGFARLHDVERATPIQYLRHYHTLDTCGTYLYPPEWSANGSQLATYELTPITHPRPTSRLRVHLIESPEPIPGMPLYAMPDSTLEDGAIAYLADQTELRIVLVGDTPGWYFIETMTGQRDGWIYDADPLAALELIYTPPANKIWLWTINP